jgi:hypothetical protein
LRFRAGACVRVHHVWPGVYPAAARRVLFVRDPCDALYSGWRRHLARDESASDFPAYCGSAHFHYPLSRLDYLRVFLRTWRRETERSDVRVVRFEDYRADARAMLAGTMAWLGLAATPAELARAVDASSVERVKAEDRRLHRLGVVDATLVRGEGEFAELVRQRFRLACRRHGINAQRELGLDMSRFAPPRTASPQGELF